MKARSRSASRITTSDGISVPSPRMSFTSLSTALASRRTVPEPVRISRPVRSRLGSMLLSAVTAMPPVSMRVARVSIFCSRSGMLAGPSRKPSAWKLTFATAETQITASCFSVKTFRASALAASAVLPGSGRPIQMPAPTMSTMERIFMLPFGFQFNELRADAALDEEHDAPGFAVPELCQHFAQRGDALDLSLVDGKQHIARGEPGQRGPPGVLHGANTHRRRVGLQSRVQAVIE